ncbi:Type I restriction-modification system, M subunit [Rickettsia canadensis str. CA410]|uniref:Type I restriction-modification system, M subunit n=1 Tax=Rickettsia canadensis str. CA410 TaxID=1105107 RepID=A0ABM5MTY2_RICCA|nr:Type I restriction-modification system, M subunit [Rickettsia canadensis str. CA410]
MLLENDTLMDFDIVVASPLLSLEKLGLGMKNAANDEYNRFKRGTHPKAIIFLI